MEKTTYTKYDDKKQILVKREFNAEIPMVWKAWTEPQHLDKWWAPRPWKNETKSMNFTNGGNWLYSMQGPAGEKHWAKMNYNNIILHKGYDAVDAFCDEEGNENLELPGSNWEIRFTGEAEVTNVDVMITFASTEAMEMTVQMGFKEGFAMAHNTLDEVLEALKNNKE